MVDVADIWGEGYYSYPWRPDMLVCQKFSRCHNRVALNITECHMKG